jgi:hypothetical protein
VVADSSKEKRHQQMQAMSLSLGKFVGLKALEPVLEKKERATIKKEATAKKKRAAASSKAPKPAKTKSKAKKKATTAKSKTKEKAPASKQASKKKSQKKQPSSKTQKKQPSKHGSESNSESSSESATESSEPYQGDEAPGSGLNDSSDGSDDTAAVVPEFKLHEVSKVGEVLVFAGVAGDGGVCVWLAVVESVKDNGLVMRYLKGSGVGVWERDDQPEFSVWASSPGRVKKGDLGLGAVLGMVDWVDGDEKVVPWAEGGRMSEEEWEIHCQTVNSTEFEGR